jgi:hypothetical protein
MKKILFTLICLTSLKAFAQDKIYGGIRLSPNFSMIYDDAEAYKSVKSGVGYSIGYFEVLELSYKINLQGEINYSNYSFRTDIDEDPTKTKYETTNYSSVEVPIAIKYRPTESVAVGVGYQFSLASRMTDNSKQYGSEFSEETGGTSTSGFFFDINGKFGKSIYGLRVTKFNNEFVNTDKLINVSAYIGIGLF